MTPHVFARTPLRLLLTQSEDDGSFLSVPLRCWGSVTARLMARVRGGGPPIGLEHALDFDTAETSAVHELAVSPQLTPPAEAPDGLGKLWGLYEAGTKMAEHQTD